MYDACCCWGCCGLYPCWGGGGGGGVPCAPETPRPGEPIDPTDPALAYWLNGRLAVRPAPGYPPAPLRGANPALGAKPPKPTPPAPAPAAPAPKEEAPGADGDITLPASSISGGGVFSRCATGSGAAGAAGLYASGGGAGVPAALPLACGVLLDAGGPPGGGGGMPTAALGVGGAYGAPADADCDAMVLTLSRACAAWPCAGVLAAHSSWATTGLAPGGCECVCAVGCAVGGGEPSCCCRGCWTWPCD